jgi:hypothetical protein
MTFRSAEVKASSYRAHGQRRIRSTDRSAVPLQRGHLDVAAGLQFDTTEADISIPAATAARMNAWSD